MILQKKNLQINLVFLLNVLFCLFPLSFIFGNLITNINVVLFCCLGVLYLKSKIYQNKLDLPVKIVLLFFLIVLFSTSLSLIESLYIEKFKYYNFEQLIKSIVFFRFFLMLVIIYLLSSLNILNFKYFCITVTLVTLAVSLDVIFQFIFGFNTIGLESYHFYNSGFFGDELIAGGYIKNFSFFSIFFVAFFFKNKSNVRIILTTLVICIFGVAILVSGNRMPLILFLFGLFLIFLFNSQLKKMFSLSLLILFITFGFLGSLNYKISETYLSYYSVIKKVFEEAAGQPQDSSSKIITKEDIESERSLDVKKNKWQKFFTKDPQWKEGEIISDDFEFFWVLQYEEKTHLKIYATALDTWSQNKIFGNGIKSFRQDCKKFLLHKTNRLCSNHPHNYYLEILTDTGIVGILSAIIIGLLFIIFILKNFKSLNTNNLQNLILFAATISFILEVFPLKSTGSIFSTNNATYLILISSIIVSYKKILKIKF